MLEPPELDQTIQNPSSNESFEVITTFAPVETRLAENPPSAGTQINAKRGKETFARRRQFTAFVREYDVPFGDECVGNSDPYLAGQVVIATSGKPQCIVGRRARLMAGWRLVHGGDSSDALQRSAGPRSGSGRSAGGE